MHVDGLMPASFCLVTLLSSKKYERFRLQQIQVINAFIIQVLRTYCYMEIHIIISGGTYVLCIVT